MSQLKFNLFDAVVIVLLVIVGITVFFKAQAFLGIGSGDANTLRETSVDFEIRVEGVRDASVNAYSIGDEIVASETRHFIGTVTAIDVIPYEDLAENAQGEFVLSQVPEKYTVILRVNAAAIETNRGFVVGGYDIKVGKQFDVENKLTKGLCTVFAIEVKE